MALNETQVSPNEAALSREILQFLNDGEAKLELGRFKNVTLVLGFTGSGKSTLTQFVTDNDQGLFAKEVGVESGEFTIIDENHNVCRATIESCTIVPKLYIEKGTNSGFYDCPGFGDTRSVKHDISVTYFIKKVIDSVDSVKLLFVVNYPSVRQGVDRQNFMLLVKNTLNMVKNIDKFKDGIALAVAKVDNGYVIKRGQATLISDNTVISNIADFLKSAQDSLKAKLVSEPEGQSFTEEAIKFIDILLEKDGGGYKRIGIFRRPDEEGKLGESELLKSGKIRLKKILHENIHYVRKTADDFGYTLSADSLNHMHALISHINEDLAQNFHAMGLLIRDHYHRQETKSRDIDELQRIFTNAHETLLGIKETRNYSTPTALMNKINEMAESQNIQILSEMKMNVAHYDYFLTFLSSISGLQASSLHWVQGLNDVVENLSERRTWLTFLNDLQRAMSKYSSLTDVRRNRKVVEILRDRINSFEGSGSQESLFEDLGKFLRQVFKTQFKSQTEKIKSLQKVTVEEWGLLRELLDFEVDYLCSDTLILKGQYVTLSDVDNAKCSRKTLKLFAWRKVFIDKNFLRGSSDELVIMAPTWEVIGAPKIILDGKPGKDASPRKAVDGNYFTIDGNKGEDGGDGGQGGLFWGIGQTCINCHQLSISVNGGRGGAGQDGGDGADGKDYYHTSQGPEHGTMITIVYNTRFLDTVRYGQRGGNGGRGGMGGLGGPQGKVEIVIFEDGAKPNISAVEGSPGRSGYGGSPGLGGRSNRIIARTRAVLVIPWERTEVIDLGRAEHGSWGAKGQTPPWTYSSTYKFSSPAKTLTGYTTDLQLQTNNNLTDATTRLFIQNLKKTTVTNLERHIGRRSITDESEPSNNKATNSGNTKSSFLNNALLWITTMVMPFWKPRNHFRQYAVDNEELKQWGSKGQTSPFGIHENTEALFNIPKIGHRSNDPQNADSGIPSTLCVPSNLLLLEYLVRMKISRERYQRRKSNSIQIDVNAQQLAYSAHIRN